MTTDEAVRESIDDDRRRVIALMSTAGMLGAYRRVARRIGRAQRTLSLHPDDTTANAALAELRNCLALSRQLLNVAEAITSTSRAA